MQRPANENQAVPPESQDASLQQKLQGLQKEYQIKEQQADNLQKVNSNLTNQLNRYAELLSEEKSEKKELLQKYDTLQTTYQQKIERFSRKYYLLLWLFLALLVFLIYQYAGNFREAIGL